MVDGRRQLYEDRAELGDLEDDIADLKSHLAEGGVLWRICSWMDRIVKRHRAEVQAEINHINTKEGEDR